MFTLNGTGLSSHGAQLARFHGNIKHNPRLLQNPRLYAFMVNTK